MLEKKIAKSSTMEELERALSGLIQDGANRIELHIMPSENKNRRSIFALATYAEISELAEGVLLLASNLKPDPAHIVVRSMQEGYFNLAYILQSADSMRLIEFLYWSAKRDRGNLKSVKQYLKSHKNSRHAKMLEQFNDRGAITGLTTMISGTEKELVAKYGRHPADYDESSLWSRSKDYDKTSKEMGEETHHALDYLALYSHFCRYAHVGTSTLAGKIQANDASFTLGPSNPVPNCEQALMSGFAYLADTLILTLHQIGVSKDEVDKLNEKLRGSMEGVLISKDT